MLSKCLLLIIYEQIPMDTKNVLIFTCINNSLIKHKSWNKIFRLIRFHYVTQCISLEDDSSIQY